MFLYEVWKEIERTIMLNEAKWCIENNRIINEMTKLETKFIFFIEIKKLLKQRSSQQDKISELEIIILFIQAELEHLRGMLSE
ncbi:MAG: hypothetical protein ABIE43_02930 [Patescibacteria group bacterium]